MTAPLLYLESDLLPGETLRRVAATRPRHAPTPLDAPPALLAPRLGHGMTQPVQLTVDGREEAPCAPTVPDTFDAAPLFTAPATVRGQLAMPDPTKEDHMRSV